MKKFFTVTALTILLILSACSKAEKSDFKIYIVERSKITNSLNDSEIVSTAKGSGRLAFDGDDISGYNWETHTVTIKSEAITSLGAVTPESGGSSIFKTDDTYAFVFILNDTLIYYGGFDQGSKNPAVPLQPYIKDNDRYSFSILFDSKYSDSSDSRSNTTLYSFLNKFGLLSSKSN